MYYNQSTGSYLIRIANIRNEVYNIAAVRKNLRLLLSGSTRTEKGQNV